MRSLMWVAVGLMALFCVLDALGLVDELGVLTMMPPAGQSFEVALGGAALYLLSWFGAVVMAPIFLLGAGIDRLLAVPWRFTLQRTARPAQR